MALAGAGAVVSFEDGEPAYEIVHPAAWDAIGPLEHPGSSGLLYHGSLALRSQQSRESLAMFRAAGAGRVFVDINLRPPWYEREVLLEALNGADWVLSRVACGIHVSADDIAGMGIGGLLKEIPTRPQPRNPSPRTKKV